MKYRGRYETPEEFGQIVIRSLPNGEVLRLKDVADIELAANPMPTRAIPTATRASAR